MSKQNQYYPMDITFGDCSYDGDIGNVVCTLEISERFALAASDFESGTMLTHSCGPSTSSSANTSCWTFSHQARLARLADFSLLAEKPC
ncbi:hypothetical protein TNIN_118431 [Trichonephila inaurata madagascariensis]|uniref:Uncharacterized protein n=1 Tax=Trichonephila inaurata madagascariensis TaxID=2747483 RepID=A0A8X6II91_9ARAC|nr:hypothetical protein TNIN_118431 [Trichonephila inaurata madagascariensis]